MSILINFDINNNAKGDEFVCYTGVRQGECLSPFLFSMFVNDLEQEMISKDIAGLDLDYFKLFLLMYADDIVLFSKTDEGLQNGLNCIYDYCQKWKLSVNTQKTKVMIFRKGGILRRNTQFKYGENNLEIIVINSHILVSSFQLVVRSTKLNRHCLDKLLKQYSHWINMFVNL